MRKFFTLVCLCLSAKLYAQTPDKMSYQSVIRDANNSLIANTTVSIRISILKGSISGSSVYSETHSIKTTNFGLANFEIGAGNPVNGQFSDINWSQGLFFIKSEVDPTGGNSYTITSTSQFLSVPYAFYAKKAESIQYDYKPVSFIYKKPSDGATDTLHPGDSAIIFIGAQSYLYESEDINISAEGIPFSFSQTLNRSTINLENAPEALLRFMVPILQQDTLIPINIKYLSKSGKKKNIILKLIIKKPVPPEPETDFLKYYVGRYTVNDSIIGIYGQSIFQDSISGTGIKNNIQFNRTPNLVLLSGKYAIVDSLTINIPIQGTGTSANPIISGRAVKTAKNSTNFRILYSREVDGVVEHRHAWYIKN